MKVVYETIEHQIKRAIDAADTLGKRIAYIELVPHEANEFIRSISSYSFRDRYTEPLPLYTTADAGKLIGGYMGAELRVGAV